MFGMGGTEILVILIVALLFLGPDKLPEAAKQISKGIRDIKKQSRVLQRTIEEDEHIGGAIRDLKSALRGEDEPLRPRPIKPKKQLGEPASPGSEIAGTSGGSEIAGASGTPVVMAAMALAATAQPGAGAALAAPAASGALGTEHGAGPDAPAASHPAAGSAVEAAAAPAEPSIPGGDGHAAPDAGATAAARPALTMPPSAGEPDEDVPVASAAGDDAELAAMVRPAPNTIPRQSQAAAAAAAAPAAAAAAAPEAASAVAPSDTSGSKHG